MLGVFGNTPAMDSFFMKGIGQSNFSNLNYLESLEKVQIIWNGLKQYYDMPLINDYKILTFSFGKGGLTFNYPKAKLIDMLFFEK